MGNKEIIDTDIDSKALETDQMAITNYFLMTKELMDRGLLQTNSVETESGKKAVMIIVLNAIIDNDLGFKLLEGGE